MDIQIIVDSCCDLTPALRNLLRVSVASLKIDVGSIHYVDDERIDTKKLIADMKAYKNAPSTACPSPDEYAALMEKSEESFVVTLSGKLSGSYNAAQRAAEESRQEQRREQIQQIPLAELHPFTNHPFKVLDDESMQRTVESVEQYGVCLLYTSPSPRD